MTVGEIVRMCRWGKGWSQRQLSEESGIARQTITDVERGARGSSVAILVELLDAMGCDLIVAEKIKDGEQTEKYRIAKATIDKAM